MKNIIYIFDLLEIRQHCDYKIKQRSYRAIIIFKIWFPYNRVVISKCQPHLISVFMTTPEEIGIFVRGKNVIRRNDLVKIN